MTALIVQVRAVVINLEYMTVLNTVRKFRQGTMGIKLMDMCHHSTGEESGAL